MQKPYPRMHVDMDMGEHQMKPAAVAVCLRGLSGHGASYEVMLVRRSSSLREFPGAISFPGGSLEATDDDIAECALRELGEETSLRPSRVFWILTPVATSDFSYCMTPVVCVVDESDEPKFEPGGEIESAFWIPISGFNDRNAPSVADLSFPIRTILIETAARQLSHPTQACSPHDWFSPHNSFSYMYRQWESALNLVETYGAWLPYLERTCGMQASKAFEELIVIHKRQADDLRVFLEAYDAGYRPIHIGFSVRGSFYFDGLFGACGLDFSHTAHVDRTDKDWQNVFRILFVTYRRGLERYMGLRRVPLANLPLSPNVFWAANHIWSQFMQDAFFNANLAHSLVADSSHTQWERNFYIVEADLMLRIWRHQSLIARRAGRER